MNNKSTTRKAEGLGSVADAEPTGNYQRTEDRGRRTDGGRSATRHTDNGGQRSEIRSVPQLDDEQLVLATIMQALRGLKMGGRPRVSQIAREWERIFNYRIQVTMQERQRRAKARMIRMQVAASLKAAASPDGASLPGATVSLPLQGGSLALKVVSAHNGKSISSPSGVRIRLNVSRDQD